MEGGMTLYLNKPLHLFLYSGHFEKYTILDMLTMLFLGS